MVDLNRRDFLRLSLVTALSAGIASCAKPTEQVQRPPAQGGEPTKAAEPAATTQPAATEPAASKFKEAPMLAELVQQGQLPPVEERLPINPCVCPVMDGIGNYGGTIRRGFKGVSDRNGPSKMTAEGLTWYTPDLNVRANMIESWEINADASEWTLNLRKGMKWSDGAPWDSDSFEWYWQNDLMNEELTSSVPRRLRAGTESIAPEAEFPDKYTVIYRWTQPNPLFGMQITRATFASPGHFLKDYHKELTEDKAALDNLVTELGVETWVDVFDEKSRWYMTVELPQTGPWISANKLSEEMFIMERNPYFWQVDPEGNQLPYVDKVIHRLYSSVDTFNMWIVNGEIDFQARGVSLGNFTLYKEGEEKGGYQVFLGPKGSHMGLNGNMTCKDPKIREFWQNRDVRIALSHAVNREEINDLVYDGMMVPRQYSPISKSPQYYPKLSNAYIEYDPDQANELLDKAGYDKRDSEGNRLWKDGSGPVSFIIEGTTPQGDPGEDAVQMIVKYFADIGITATYKYLERSLYTEHFNANEIDCAYWGGDRTVLPIAAPMIFLGTMIDRPWACAWGKWKNNPNDVNAEEPPADHWIRTIWDIWDKVAMEPDDKKRNEIFFQILDIWAEEIPMNTYLGEQPAPIIVKNGFRGYLNGYPLDDTIEDEHLLSTQSYYWEEPEQHM